MIDLNHLKMGGGEVMKFVEPQIIELGCLEELTGSGGASYDDGWYWSFSR